MNILSIEASIKIYPWKCPPAPIVLGVDLFAQPWPLPTTYSEEVTVLKTWLSDRINWIDNNIPGDCTADVVSTNELQNNQPYARVYPNPTNNQFTVELVNANLKNVQLLDLSGKLIINKKPNYSNKLTLKTLNLNSGIYLIRILSDNGIINSKVIIE